MRLCVNWLPVSPDLTAKLARKIERAGLWGLGIGDSPNYGELYGACADALAATDSLRVLTSVTNPVTRHVSLHASAARTYGGRLAIGMGRGDSAVRTFRLEPAPLPVLEDTLRRIRDAAPEAPLLVAGAGTRAAAVAGRVADGLICGAGRDATALRTLADVARSAGQAIDTWASVRLAIARDSAEVPELRRRMLPRAISAARFNFGRDLTGKNIPDRFHAVLTERFGAYDFAWHGRAGATPTAALFADRPDVETYLIDRFTVVGTAQDCRDRLADLHRDVDGVFCSLLFEDILDQADRLADLFTAEELAC